MDETKVVASVTALDILTLHLKARPQVQARVDHPSRPEMSSRVVPLTRKAGDSKFQVVMGFVWQKQSQARASGRSAVQIRHRVVGFETHVPAQIKHVGISCPIRRTWPVHPEHRIVEQL